MFYVSSPLDFPWFSDTDVGIERRFTTDSTRGIIPPTVRQVVSTESESPFQVVNPVQQFHHQGHGIEVESKVPFEA